MHVLVPPIIDKGFRVRDCVISEITSTYATKVYQSQYMYSFDSYPCRGVLDTTLICQLGLHVKQYKTKELFHMLNDIKHKRHSTC